MLWTLWIFLCIGCLSPTVVRGRSSWEFLNGISTESEPEAMAVMAPIQETDDGEESQLHKITKQKSEVEPLEDFQRRQLTDYEESKDGVTLQEDGMTKEEQNRGDRSKYAFKKAKIVTEDQDKAMTEGMQSQKDNQNRLIEHENISELDNEEDNIAKEVTNREVVMEQSKKNSSNKEENEENNRSFNLNKQEASNSVNNYAIEEEESSFGSIKQKAAEASELGNAVDGAFVSNKEEIMGNSKKSLSKSQQSTEHNFSTDLSHQQGSKTKNVKGEEEILSEKRREHVSTSGEHNNDLSGKNKVREVVMEQNRKSSSNTEQNAEHNKSENLKHQETSSSKNDFTANNEESFIRKSKDSSDGLGTNFNNRNNEMVMEQSRKSSRAQEQNQGENRSFNFDANEDSKMSSAQNTKEEFSASQRVGERGLRTQTGHSYGHPASTEESSVGQSNGGNQEIKDQISISHEQSYSFGMPNTYLLKGIRSWISPELLHALASCGWQDEIVLVDSTFPVEEKTCENSKVIHLDGIPLEALVIEIMNLWKLDENMPLALVVKNQDVTEVIKKALSWILPAEENCGCYSTMDNAELLNEQDFLLRVKSAKYIIKTGEHGPCNNIILRKGIIYESCGKTNGCGAKSETANGDTSPNHVNTMETRLENSEDQGFSAQSNKAMGNANDAHTNKDDLETRNKNMIRDSDQQSSSDQNEKNKEANKLVQDLKQIPIPEDFMEEGVKLDTTKSKSYEEAANDEFENKEMVNDKTTNQETAKFESRNIENAQDSSNNRMESNKGNMMDFKNVADGYVKSVDVELNGTFSNGDNEENGEVIMNIEALTKKKHNGENNVEKSAGKKTMMLGSRIPGGKETVPTDQEEYLNIPEMKQQDVKEMEEMDMKKRNIGAVGNMPPM